MKRSTKNNLKIDYKIIFLHHSTGRIIYDGHNQYNRIIRKIFQLQSYVPKWIKNHNQINGTNYQITEQYFPQKETYGWNNYPYDYYNIWIKNAGEQPFQSEPTLEILTKKYNLIIFKHCFPVSNILEDINRPDINSTEKRIENYKLQYIALKRKLNEFPNTKFLIWIGPALLEANTTKEQALRAKVFFDWVRNVWNTGDDNVFLWDFYELETEGTLFMKTENSINPMNSHPGKSFAQRVAPLFCQRIVDVIEGRK